MDSSSLPAGLYEELLTEELWSLIGRIGEDRQARVDVAAPADLAGRIARHVEFLVGRVLEAVPEDERAERSVSIIDGIRALLSGLVEDDLEGLGLCEPVQLLKAVEPRLPDGSYRSIERPLTPLLDTTVFVNARGEPSLLHELVGEIPSAHRIDVLMAFVRWTGIRHLLAPLQRRVQDGVPVRLLTTTYTNSTQLSALQALRDVGVEVRVSYDTSTTRLHAKAWLFHRQREMSTAYVGSSNLTHSALTPGLEWNVRLSEGRNQAALARMRAVFESYWASGDFEEFDDDTFQDRTAALSPATSLALPPTELMLRPFQERLVEQIQLARDQGHHRNLLVAATGTGKTVMAAVDYRRLRASCQRARLLFVAHRQEILEQSLRTFRHALGDGGFGELWVGTSRPKNFEHVFASIQSLTASGIESIDPDWFDIVIVDEFHHAGAPTYERLLTRLTPQELLGLTATPERADGLDVLKYFDGRIAAELRIWDAIDQQHLVPFAYYGIHDGLDLREVPFKRGTGYDVDALTNVYTASHVWVRQVVAELRRRIGDVVSMRAIGFCVSVRHAEFMCAEFNRVGISAVAVSGASSEEERARALRRLRDGEISTVFAVDLLNEGVDVPTVDTLLLLRPTESATLFLQQLGRGLRRADGKGLCTVLDFVGTHRREFRFDLRYRAVLGGSRQDLQRQVEQGFPFLPSGCHIELDPVAQQVVLDSIKSALPSNFPQRVAELRSLGDVSLAEYLDATGLELEDVYSAKRTWTDHRRAAGFVDVDEQQGPFVATWRAALARLLHVDDGERLAAYAALVESDGGAWDTLSVRQQRLGRMLIASMYTQQSLRTVTPPSNHDEALEMLRQHHGIASELRELCDVLATRRNHLSSPLAGESPIPLHVHARYSRVEIQAAYHDGAGLVPPNWDSGVKWVPDAQTDLLVFTLDKTAGGFSPSTRYRDYALSRDLIHWESQSVTSVASPTGQRYLAQGDGRTNVMLFARLRRGDRAFWCLGPARYQRHEGERPIAITWRLDEPLPGDLFADFRAVA